MLVKKFFRLIAQKNFFTSIVFFTRKTSNYFEDHLCPHPQGADPAESLRELYYTVKIVNTLYL
jgi:hypothetical protein